MISLVLTGMGEGKWGRGWIGRGMRRGGVGELIRERGNEERGNEERGNEEGK